MVQRKAARGRDEAKPKGKRRGHNVQQPGVLMTNNPLIPPELDEDIDDDLAFNSEDERLYGHLFENKKQSQSLQSSRKQGGKKRLNRAAYSDSDEDDDGFTGKMHAISKTERGKKKGKDSDENDNLYNYHEDGQSSDDGEDYIDLSDMLDMSMKTEKAEKKSMRRKATATAEDGHAISKKRRGGVATTVPESLYGAALADSDSGSAHTFGAAMREFVSTQTGNVAEAAVKSRLERSLKNKRNLLSVDTDEKTKTRLTRKEVRSVVDEDLQKYKTLLREMSDAKHLQFPLTAPMSNPTPSSIGGIVSAAQSNLRAPDAATSKQQQRTSASALASKMDSLLSSAGLSAPRHGNASDERGSSTLGDHVQFDSGNNDDGDDNGENRRHGRRDETDDDNVPSTGYMAKLKAMLASENSRRKRFNKIKSKTYRRILRKEKEREKERRQKAFELLHPELARKRLAEKLLKARIEERVTQKHRNTSAWVKHAKRFVSFDDNAKDAVNEQLSLHQKLMRKMDQDAGEDDYERYAGDGNESEISSEEDRVVDQLLQASAEEQATGQLADRKALTSALWRAAADGSDGAGGDDTEKGGVIAKARAELKEMKFMKAAKDREEKEYAEQMNDLMEDIRRYQNSTDDDDKERHGALSSLSNGAEKITNTSTLGRKQFTQKASGSLEVIQLKKQKGPFAAAMTDEHPSVSSGNDEAEDSDSNGSEAEARRNGNNSNLEGSVRETPDAASTTMPANKKSLQSQTSRKKTTATPTFAADRLSRGKKSKGESGPSSLSSSSTRITILPASAKRVREHPDTDKEEDEEGPSTNGDDELPHDSDSGDNDDLQLHQEYLISRAFAHDDVDEEFLQEKQAQVQTILKPEDKNMSLPGWGEWGGENPNLNKRHREKLEHSTLQREIEKTFLMKSRADASLDHVIINHDGVDLVPDRMTLHMVPRPFSNPQEFARSMRQPVGPEWSSALSFKEGVQPRIEVRQGHTVVPLDLSLRQKKNKTKRRKLEQK